MDLVEQVGSVDAYLALVIPSGARNDKGSPKWGVERPILLAMCSPQVAGHRSAHKLPERTMKSDTLDAQQGPTIVLVHGGFVDGSGWQKVYGILRKDGYAVRVVQNPTTSLADDVAATHRIVDAEDRPVILVGHSYGGVVVTEAGNHPNVVGLVYIAAFAPDKGESVSALIKDPPPGAPVPPILPPQDGFLLLDRTKFAASFAADVDTETAEFMAESQLPWGVEALNGVVTEPAWRTKPSWYLVATDDRMIPPPAQRAMAERAGSTITETAGSHAVYVSKPGPVATIVATAIKGVAVATT